MKVGEDLALIQLEGVWQNRLATFKAHGNINIRDEMKWSENWSTAKQYFFWQHWEFPWEISNYLSNCLKFLLFWFCHFCIYMSMVEDGQWQISEWSICLNKIKCVVASTLHFPHSKSIDFYYTWIFDFLETLIIKNYVWYQNKNSFQPLNHATLVSLVHGLSLAKSY